MTGDKQALNKNKKAVLIIDDDKSVLRTFSRVLEKNGFQTDMAETGKEAIEKAGRRSFNVVLVDLRLPDMDGTALLPKLKEKLPDSVGIMITGLPSVDTGSRALDGGADAYLVKPVMPNDLISLIEEKLKLKNSCIL